MWTPRCFHRRSCPHAATFLRGYGRLGWSSYCSLGTVQGPLVLPGPHYFLFDSPAFPWKLGRSRTDPNEHPAPAVRALQVPPLWMAVTSSIGCTHNTHASLASDRGASRHQLSGQRQWPRARGRGRPHLCRGTPPGTRPPPSPEAGCLECHTGAGASSELPAVN